MGHCRSPPGETDAREGVVLRASHGGSLRGPEHPGEDPCALGEGMGSMGSRQTPRPLL